MIHSSLWKKDEIRQQNKELQKYKFWMVRWEKEATNP